MAEDVKRLAVMDTTKGKTEEFTKLVAEDGWDKALSKFNDLYKSEPNMFRLENLPNLYRIPNASPETFVVQSSGSPQDRVFVREAQKWLSISEARIESRFIDQLYSLVPQDSNTVKNLPVSIEFKPHMSFYVIKNISVNRLSQQAYERIRATQAYRQEHLQNQSLAVIHFNPENIVKRMKFHPAKESTEPADANAQPEPEESS